MAKFEVMLPTDITKDFMKVYDYADSLFGQMTEAGAKVVYMNVINNMRSAFKNPAKLIPYLKITRVYRTIYDDALNCKVGFYGYYDKGKDYVHRINRKGTEAREYQTGRKHKAVRLAGRQSKSYEYKYGGVPVPLIALAREYGTSSGEAKKPFFRKAFVKSAITKVMLDLQKALTGGLLE